MTASIEQVLVVNLTPYARNSRTHSKRQIKQIANSIKEFGFNNPVLIDRNNTIIAGHGRAEAAKLLQLTTVPTLRLDHLTPDQVRAYIIADNRLAENAGWDREILKIELQHLSTIDLGFDVTLTGFEVPEIDLIIQGTEKDAKPEIVELETDGPAVTATGDLWQLGRHRLICGDSLNENVYQQLMQGDLADVVISDLPYNVKIDGHASGLGEVHHREFAMAAGEMDESEFIDFLQKACAQLAMHSQQGSLHYLFMDWRHLFELLTAGRAAYAEFKNMAVWTKDTAGMGSLYRSQHELVLIFKNGKSPHRNNVQLGKFGRNRTNVWQYPGVNAFARQTEEGPLGKLHPTVKPVAMIVDALLDCTARGNIVLDAFLGSGTTLIAAERIGRVCRAIEIDPLYVDVAIRRWQRVTGDAAVHVATGRRFDDIAATSEVSSDE
ncbi:site-specific DNA-methyltransferase [Stenotrophobium rhamnosiphilum]|uniref:Methyltransferase n=1 Tax=Stenotrophobium rhamnosiphilum TaxID=2029166 RepID=A0A2T5MBP4_9GAMM|nr:DNA methyltransferase [Stenotrophobium rhamnosiphilum]PTU29175.1 DNA methylase N-4 [Stenotrophobium rhamnosiphilum]